jgi:pyruvate formate lyase activating enzyme
MCGACISRCPIGAISYGESAVITDRKKCTGCGACVPACYFDARAIEGTVKTAAEVLEVALKDKKMYARTGGGLTLSGGDPTMQPDFSEALLKLAKHNKLNTCMESCGQTNWDILERLLKYTDILFFDIKTLDPLKHKEGTGTGNAVILENAKKAAAVVKDMRVRCPMIPGFNDSPEDVKAIADFVTKELRLPSDHFTILKYNKYAEGKYDKLDREDEVKHLEPQTEDYMDALNAVIESA